MKKYIYWIVGAVILTGVIVWFVGIGGATNEFNDWVKGNASSTIKLIEYSDFQCQACAAYRPIMDQLEEEFGDKIAIIYRHFPLRQHRYADLAAIVAEAAGRQGKFWEMHNIIFVNQNQWSSGSDAASDFVNYAYTLELDLDRFADDIKSRELENKVRDDYKKGLKMKVNSIPTFFLNGKKIRNPQNYEEFKSIIEEMINQNG